ncbi:hypothetical protein [Azospirillum palustre]
MRLPPKTDDDGTARARPARCRRTGGSGGGERNRGGFFKLLAAGGAASLYDIRQCRRMIGRVNCRIVAGVSVTSPPDPQPFN